MGIFDTWPSWGDLVDTFTGKKGRIGDAPSDTGVLGDLTLGPVVDESEEGPVEDVEDAPAASPDPALWRGVAQRARAGELQRVEDTDLNRRIAAILAKMREQAETDATMPQAVKIALVSVAALLAVYLIRRF